MKNEEDIRNELKKLNEQIKRFDEAEEKTEYEKIKNELQSYHSCIHNRAVALAWALDVYYFKEHPNSDLLMSEPEEILKTMGEMMEEFLDSKE